MDADATGDATPTRRSRSVIRRPATSRGPSSTIALSGRYFAGLCAGWYLIGHDRDLPSGSFRRYLFRVVTGHRLRPRPSRGACFADARLSAARLVVVPAW